MSNTSSLFGNMKGERREKKEKGFGNETMGARAEQRGGSTRQEDMREGGKVESVEGKTDMITKETARNLPPPPAGQEETEECGADKEEKEYGEKKEREWEDSEREKKKKSIE